MTATEADPNRRKGFMPWWRKRSWNTDLDTLTRLHKGLLALNVDPDAQHNPAPAPALPTPSAGLPAPQELRAGTAGREDGADPARTRIRTRPSS